MILVDKKTLCQDLPSFLASLVPIVQSYFLTIFPKLLCILGLPLSGSIPFIHSSHCPSAPVNSHNNCDGYFQLNNLAVDTWHFDFSRRVLIDSQVTIIGLLCALVLNVGDINTTTPLLLKYPTIYSSPVPSFCTLSDCTLSPCCFCTMGDVPVFNSLRTLATAGSSNLSSGDFNLSMSS